MPDVLPFLVMSTFLKSVSEMVSMLAMFRSFHVHIDLGRKEFLWRSVLEYIHLSFNGWCARVAAYISMQKTLMKI